MSGEPPSPPAEPLLNHLLLPSYSLGWLRLLLVAAFLALMMYLGRISFESIDMNAVLEGWKARPPLWDRIQLDRIPDFFLMAWASLFSGDNLRYLYLPLAALVGAILLGSSYIHRSYALKRFRQALRYLISAMFAIGYPRLTVSEGKLKLKPDETNTLDVIGGPGVLDVKPGNLVLLEKLQGGNDIHEAGRWLVNRSQRIKEAVSLEDQHDFVESVSAKTKDGIPIVVRDIHFRYRLGTIPPGDFAVRTPDNPYPYSEGAIRDMANNRSVTRDGLVPWRAAVRQIVEGTITEYIYRHQVDHLTAPSFQENDPRLQIIRLIDSPNTRARFNRIGADLLWFDMGHFDIAEEKVKDQRLDTWGAKWLGDAKVIKSYGEAQREIYREIGRAEGQAEMLMSIVDALQTIASQGPPGANLNNILLVRTAQIIESYAQKEIQPPDQDVLPPPPPRRRPPGAKKP